MPTAPRDVRFQSDPLEAVGGIAQNLQQGCRFARYLHFLHDPACVIHNADAGLLDRYVQSSKMVHSAFLLLMLEAVTTDLVFTISLKRSTQNLQLSTSWAGRLHHLLRDQRTWHGRDLRSESDAVDGSSTGTSVPWMWALLRLPRFRGASHADDNDNRFRHRQVGFPGSWGCGQVIVRRQLKRRYVLTFLPEAAAVSG